MTTLFIPPAMRTVTGGKSELNIEAKNVGELLDLVNSKFPGFKERVLENGSIKPGVAVLCDGVPTRYGVNEFLEKVKEVHIVPAISGGGGDDLYASHTEEAVIEAMSEKIKDGVSGMLEKLSSFNSVDKKGVLDTPNRIKQMYKELLVGYTQDPNKVLNNALFDVKYDEMVVATNIDFYSLCEHHLMPFYGRIDVGYIPKDKVVGISKIPRIVDIFARRLQVQERLTENIAEALAKILEAKGVGVVVRATHLCMTMRGVKKPNAEMITSALRGTFKSDQRTRDEFMNHLNFRRY